MEPKLEQSCAFATCHSSPQSDFYITCGADDDQRRFNFLQAAGFVVAAPAPPEQSEILLRPLSPANGGVSHTGGIFFDSRADQTWSKWRDWAVEVQASPPAALSRSAGQVFFEENVMPKLLQRGCALEGCHSPNGFNDFRLRPGAQGFFAQLALKRNYETTLKEFMALDTVDVSQSRAVKKTIVPSSGGIVHRGGAVLESDNFVVGTDTCPTPYRSRDRGGVLHAGGVAPHRAGRSRRVGVGHDPGRHAAAGVGRAAAGRRIRRCSSTRSAAALI